MKPYDVGLICGRFQTYHIGHESLINMGTQLCDRILILIGSSQECGTERNPLNINTRTKMLKEIYGDSPEIMIYALSDLTDENDIRQLNRTLDLLDEDDDVQNVYHNVEEDDE